MQPACSGALSTLNGFVTGVKDHALPELCSTRSLIGYNYVFFIDIQEVVANDIACLDYLSLPPNLQLLTSCPIAYIAYRCLLPCVSSL